MKIIIALNAAWNLVNFRAGLIRALVQDGHEVLAVAPYDHHAARLAATGCRYLPLDMDTQGTNPLRDAGLFIRFIALFRRERPDVFLGYTVKPNIYGSLAAQIVDVNVINNVSGLGSVFIGDSWITRLVKRMYRLAFRRSSTVLFQNADDRGLFVDLGLVALERTALVPGSGIDLQRFNVREMPDSGRVRFLLVGRMLRDKGVVEYVEAARILRSERDDVDFVLLGFVDWQNPTAISRAQIDAWVAEGLVEYAGETDDVRDEIAASDCVVLPSYREGTPRTLLEAAAMGRPIVTTDVPGCREVIEDGETGLLCAAGDPVDLARKLGELADMTRDDRVAMGLRGRRKVEHEFDESLVIAKYRALLSGLERRVT